MNAPPPSPRTVDDRRALGAVGAALAVYAALVARFAFICDDAYISLRYARHLAEGVGLRFNAAESPPVEGYSNLLWVLWLAPFEWLGFPAVPWVAVATSAVCGALLLALVLRLARRRLELGAGELLATGLALATLPPVVVWASGGLETMACALAVFLVFERLALDPEHPRVRAAGLAALAAVLLRADGALWTGAALAAAVVAAPRPRAALRAAVGVGAFAAAGVAAQLAFRVGYHGEWIPNTARVKAGLSALRVERGFGYLASLVLELPALLLVPLAALAWSRARSRLVLGALCVVAFGAAYSVFVGGDFMAWGRFLVPALAFGALAFAALLRALATRAAQVALTALVVASALAGAFDAAPVPAGLRQRLHFRWNEETARSEARQWRVMRARADEWARVGRALAHNVEPGESMVLPNLGAISYYTELHAHDPFGLVSLDVARRKGFRRRASPGHDKQVDASFFFDRRPDYLGAWIAPSDAPGGFGVTPELAASPRVSIERRPRVEGDGLGPGEELRLLRMVWGE